MRDDDDPGGASGNQGVTRRGFLQGSAIGVASVGLLRGHAAAAEGAGPKAVGPGAVQLTLDVNGAKRSLSVEPRATLAEALRDPLGLTGTKVVCDRGACSSCTVLLDGTPTLSCMTLAIDVGARKVTTVEGLAHGGALHPVQAAFVEADALQCGYCTPGMVMSCAALHARNPHPSLDEARAAISGNLCRCGTYPRVLTAATHEAFGSLTIAGAGAATPAAGATVPVGIVGDRLVEEARGIPAGEPPPWPTNAHLQVVGKPTPRLDGAEKVRGVARYTSDVRLPGMLWARRVVSPHPHARVRAIDTSAAEKLPGVKAVHVIERAMEGAKLRDPGKVPGEKYPTVRYAGQCVAAVAATTPAIAAEAARLVHVDYEPLPFVVDLDAARKPGAPLVYPGAVDMGGSAGGGGAAKGLPQEGNVRGPKAKSRGDVAKGFAAAAVIVEGEFRTQVQTHSALETHGVVADFAGGELTVYASTQGTASVRDELATVFDLPKTKVRVVTEFMGGGFGAKFGAGTYGVLAAHLSKRAGAPVRLMLDRREEHSAVGNRPSTVQKLKLGAKKDGSLTAIELVSHGSGGIATGAGVGWCADDLYPCENFSSQQYDVFTHAGPASAFRAPGMPQGLFALEQLIDQLAEQLGQDPLALRDVLDVAKEPAPDREARRVERRLGAEAIGWAKRHKPGADAGPVKRGLGVAQVLWGRFVDPDASCEVRLHKDGSVELLSSVQDIGTGTRTALAQVVAEELGLAASDVTMRIGDTRYPIGPASGGSKTLLSISPAARRAAWQVKRELLAELAPQLGVSVEKLALAGGKLTVAGAPAKALPFRKAAARMKREQISAQASRAPDYGGEQHLGYGGVQFAEVAVDVETGIVKVDRVVAVHDCGRPLNPLAIQSQVNGGVLCGLSWALYEDRRMDPHTGRMLNANLEQYKIAGSRETPRIDVILVEQYVGRSATDAHGIGEPANAATAAAIANAVYNAIGVRLRELPMTPRTVLAALGKLPLAAGGRS